MPRAPKYCATTGCKNRIPGGTRNCPEHQSRWGKGAARARTTEHKHWAKHVRDRDGHCMIQLPGCTGRADTADHIKAVAFGGDEHDPNNGQAACWNCHGKKSSQEGHRAQGHAARH